MTPSRIEIISGQQKKAPAAILVTHGSQRLLLDAGGELEPGALSYTLPDKLDAVLLSHDHQDHIGALALLPDDVPVYCSEMTAHALPVGRKVHTVPLRGEFRIGPLTVTTGSAGHAWGSMWFHLAIGDGVFYSGDISLESSLFRFDPPPPAALALIDASYGNYQQSQHTLQQALLTALMTRPTLCPVPPSGRAIEIALLLHQQGYREMAMDDDCLAVLRAMLDSASDGGLHAGCPEHLRQLLSDLPAFSPTWPLLLAGDPDGCSGTVAALRARDNFHHRLLFTGHLTRDAWLSWQAGEVDFSRWNVHPTRHCIQCLVEQLGCKRLVPLFSVTDYAEQWQAGMGCQVLTQSGVEI